MRSTPNGCRITLTRKPRKLPKVRSSLAYLLRATFQPRYAHSLLFLTIYNLFVPRAIITGLKVALIQATYLVRTYSSWMTSGRFLKRTLILCKPLAVLDFALQANLTSKEGLLASRPRFNMPEQMPLGLLPYMSLNRPQSEL
jgi:hypothetical protein